MSQATLRATFTGFDPHKLNGVIVTDRELGHGSYATVLELEYMGLKCAGKKIHEQLLQNQQRDNSYPIRKFEEECRLLSQVRHPNIVQFLGVYFQKGMQAPILVMEFLPTNLTSCIEEYGILREEISYSILHDVALGLCYLHSQTPPIIHRDLSSNNVLLTPSMMAKISDLGLAKISNLTPIQVSRMTQTPGCPAYMPPEVMVANPKYDISVDEFSYGILMIHIFSSQWSEPQVGPNRSEPGGKLVAVKEAERREIFLEMIGNEHPLMDLILKCIDNHPQSRVHASEIVGRLAKMQLQYPASFANGSEMQRQIIEALEQRKDGIVHQKEEQKIIQLNLAHSSEVKHLQQQIKAINARNQMIKAEMDAELVELKSRAAVYDSQIECKTKQLTEEKEQYELRIMTEKEESEARLTEERELLTKESKREKERNIELVAEVHSLLHNLSRSRSETATLKCVVSKLKHNIDDKDKVIQVKDASANKKDSELEAKSRALEEKDAIISTMFEQLTKAREYLMTTKQQVSSETAL